MLSIAEKCRQRKGRRKMDNHHQQKQTVETETVTKPDEGLDRRVLDKVVAALEARLTEHVGHVDRRIAEVDAQVSLDLKAVLQHTSSQSSSFEKTMQQIEQDVRQSLDTAQRRGAEQILGVDEKLTALQ